MTLSGFMLRLTLLSSILLLGACTALPERAATEDVAVREALAAYTEARDAHKRQPQAGSERRMEIALRKYEDATVAAAERYRRANAWFQSQQVLEAALQTAPDSKRLIDAHREVADERTTRLALSDCKLDAARARYLADKSRLLEERASLEAKDYLQDWLTQRERHELNRLGENLRACAQQALASRRLSLAAETLSAAAYARGDEFVAAERRKLNQLQHPPRPAAKKENGAGKAARVTAPTPQQKIRQLRLTLQDAMTHGNLKDAKATVTELRRLEGDTAQLLDLDASLDAAIAAYIDEVSERASAHYREKQIEQARDLWQEILDLDPDNAQARTNLERAERVLKKLEELQGTTPDAPPVTAPVTTPTP